MNRTIAPPKQLVLLVDDVPTNLHVLSSALRDDYRIKTATSGKAALELARREDRPDLVLLDVMMPGEFDGLEACRRLRADERFARTRIILLSARGQSADIEAGLAAGADAYMLKPFSPLKLLDTIRGCIAADAPVEIER
jgi:CheY-like chemotaxis protein